MIINLPRTRNPHVKLNVPLVQLRRLRIEMEITQLRLAEETGVSVHHISDAEMRRRGGKELSKQELKILASYFKVPQETLLQVCKETSSKPSQLIVPQQTPRADDDLIEKLSRLADVADIRRQLEVLTEQLNRVEKMMADIHLDLYGVRK